MKNKILLFFLAVVLVTSCTTTSSDYDNDSNGDQIRSSVNVAEVEDFSDVLDLEWYLMKVYVDEKDIGFNRNSLPAELYNLFTLTFSEERVSGVSAPNRYTAPYSLGEDQSITIRMMASTLMASLFQPENLSEHEFLSYMQGAHTWNINNDSLELLSKTNDGKNVRLVFELVMG